MAYAAIVSLKLTLQNILLHPRRCSIPCKKKDIESFYEKLDFLQRFLEEYNPSHESNEQVALLEGRIRDAACGAEDLLDLPLNDEPKSKDFWPWATEKRRYLMHLVAAFRNDAYKLFPYKKEMMRWINIGLMIKKFDSIIGEVGKLKEQKVLESMEGKGSIMEKEILLIDSSKLVSSRRGNLMVGFEDQFTLIKDQLTGQSCALKVIAIVGMGGIGKTTLATHVYSDPYVVYQFDVRAWATISQSYSVRGILLGMLDSMHKLTDEMRQESEDKLGLHLYQSLKGQRYLITIDDIWDTNAWDALKMMFPDDKTGSRIILTTRIADVAVYASSSGINLHQISLLSDDQSWALLCAKVFGDESCPVSLKEIGKTIARSCRGLPLSIVVIGGLLSKAKKTRVAWQSVAKHVSSFVSSSADQCSDILRLSYNYLPQYLKACFLYMGVFPKGHEISVSKLTKMWAAEGFLRQDCRQSPEEVAERCVEDLVDRSLILMSKKNSNDKIKAFRVHDFLIDFCLKEAKNEKFLHVTKSRASLSPPRLTSDRRVSIHPVRKPKHILHIPDFLSCTSSVRSLFCVGRSFIGSSVFLRLKLLRVLDVVQVEFIEFPSQVLELRSLRYIALTCGGDIPTSITKLWKLQTLIILRKSAEYGETHLPVGIWSMAHLRHVRCDGAHLLDPFAAKFVLEDLQTVSGLCNLRFTREVLQSITNIKKVDVFYDSSEKNWSDYELANLAHLHQLQALKIRVINPSKGVRKNLMVPSTSKFQFPPSLRTLTLGGVGISWHDLEIIGSLPNLEVLKLVENACLGTEWEPNEEEFCKLKLLVLEHVNLKHWRAGSNHFPSLERLVIRRCSRLIEIPSGLGESPTLAMIELEGCKNSVLASANEILERQQSYANDGFRVVHRKRSVWQNLAKEVNYLLPSAARVVDLFWPPPLFVMKS